MKYYSYSVRKFLGVELIFFDECYYCELNE